MKIKQFRYRADNLGYVVHDESEAIAIDGGALKEILDFLATRSLRLRYVVNTHSHGDHTVGNRELLCETEAELIRPDILIGRGSIRLGYETIGVIHTPGHTDDSVCFHYHNVLVSGDTLFMGKVGRCFTGDLRGFYDSIRKLSELADDTLIYAGHDYVTEYMGFARKIEPGNPHIDAYLARYSPSHVVSTLGEEREVDPFLRLDEPAVISALRKQGLPADTEYERWESLISLM